MVGTSRPSTDPLPSALRSKRMALLAIAQELNMAEVLWTYDWMTMRHGGPADVGPGREGFSATSRRVASVPAESYQLQFVGKYG